jgi:iron complex outermembrane recepter protein
MKVSVLAAVASCIFLGVGFAGPADASIRKTTNIPAESLSDALRSLAKDRQFEILYRAEVVRDVRTAGAIGEYTPEEALRALLSGTGLAYKYLDANTVTVYPSSASGSNLTSETTSKSSTNSDASSDSSKGGGNKNSQDFRVAQVGQANSGLQAIGSDQDSEKKKQEGLTEIVVTGTRIPQTAGQGALLVRSYSREMIEQSGQTTVADFLNTLPDVSTASMEGEAQPQSFLGRTTVQLHGLPQGTTLTLLNGRRLESSYFGTFDLSNIPAAAVERVDVLPIGSSAIYGSDALAGAVNTILKKDFTGLELEAKYGGATSTDDVSASLAWGKKVDDLSVSLMLTYQSRAALLAADRAVTFTTNVPASAAGLLLVDYCDPGNVFSLTGAPLPGLGGATTAAIPGGITGKPSLAAFQATAGKTNECNFYRDFALLPKTEREGALLSASYDVGESTELFTQTIFSHQYQDNRYGDLIQLPSYAGYALSANNPYNPFGTDVGVSYSYPGVEQTYASYETFVRPLLGVRGLLPFDWHYEATAWWSHDQAHDRTSSIGSSHLQTALSSSDPATALNPFASGSPASPTLLSELLSGAAASATLDNFSNDLTSAQIVANGPLTHIPAGTIQLALGAEFDHERITEQLTGVAPLDLSRHNSAVFLETNVPLVGPRVGGGSIDRLFVTLAGRYDDYSDFGRKPTGQATIVWTPIHDLSLRAAYATAYKAPELQQIVGPVSALATPVVDPLRGGQSYIVNVENGANLNLRPESGTSRLIGMSYLNEELASFRSSINYFGINITSAL